MKFCGSLHGGLNKLAETLEVERIGPQHQAGSDSLLTAATFLKLAATFFNGPSEERKGAGEGGESEGSDGDEGEGGGGGNKSSNGRSAGTGGLGHESKGGAGKGGGGAQTAENVLAGLEEHRGILYGLGSDGTNEAPQD